MYADYIRVKIPEYWGFRCFEALLFGHLDLRVGVSRNSGPFDKLILCACIFQKGPFDFDSAMLRIEGP